MEDSSESLKAQSQHDTTATRSGGYPADESVSPSALPIVATLSDSERVSLECFSGCPWSVEESALPVSWQARAHGRIARWCVSITRQGIREPAIMASWTSRTWVCSVLEQHRDGFGSESF